MSDKSPQDQASPRPWIVRQGAMYADGRTVGSAGVGMIAHFMVNGASPGEAEQRANAAFVVESVNAVDRLRADNAELIAALKMAHAEFGMLRPFLSGPYKKGVEAAHAKLSDVLARLEGNQTK